MRHFLLVTLFFCLFPVHPICADDKSASPDTLTIVASGTGTNEDGAIRQALKNAVQQAVGIIIDAETIVKNDQIIKDEILTATQAIVTKYNPVGKPLIEAGLVTVTIKATVERRGLLQRLEKASVVSRAVEGKDLFAQAVTELEKEQDAAKIVKRVFQDFPGNVLAAEPFGKPRIIEKTSAFVTMGVTVRFSVDREKYKRWYDNFVPILAKVATKSGELRWNPEEMGLNRYDASKAALGAGLAVPNEDAARSYSRGSHWGGLLPRDVSEQSCLALFERQGSSKVVLLHFEKDAYAQASQAKCGIPVVDVVLKDASGRELDGQQHVVAFQPVRSQLLHLIFYYNDHDANFADLLTRPNVLAQTISVDRLPTSRGMICVCPYALEKTGTLLTGFTRDFKFELPLDRLNEVKSVEVRLSSRSLVKE